MLWGLVCAPAANQVRVLWVSRRQNVNFVQLGKHRIETWYFSPYPEEFYPDGFIDVVRARSQVDAPKQQYQ